MDGGRLHRLGRRLIGLSRAVTENSGDPEMTAGQRAVLTDVLRHPDSTVGDVRQRTGFAQSHVSACVAELAERGLVDTAPDPADRRRTTIRVAAVARRAILRRAARPIDDAVRASVNSPQDAERVLELLAELAALLLDEHTERAGK